ncbi:hypothetical protein V499_03491 [Pseudogymnoascus sp. VKM F-103]|nr:hypothetical protein V499_03491 [Pseudogymnoascus sp. VKM F-103]
MACGNGIYPRAITSSRFVALIRMRRFQGTVEEQWQDIYQLLFPDDDGKVSPYHESESGPSLDGAHTSRFPKDLSMEDLDSPPNYHSLEGHRISLPEDGSSFRRDPRSPVISSLRAGDGVGAELSHTNSSKSRSSTSGESAELCEEDETQCSDSDDIDTSYKALDPVKQALFDNSTRQFWDFYNGLSAPNWVVLWSKHATYKGAASSSQGTQGSTRTAPDSRTPSECPSNTASLLAPKRKKRDDDDEASNNGNPSKRSSRILPQKEGLNLACPFHKHKPWKYNHGILRFRTCSTTPFDAIFRLKRQPVSVEGWTPEMDKKITKRKDETDGERWERIYRELFGSTLTTVPSPYFVPYDLASANEADLETLLQQEVPRIVLNSLSEQVNNMDIPDAARALFDPSTPYFQFENLIGNAIREVFTMYRSATATANNSTAPSTTTQPSSDNASIADDSSVAQSTCWERTTVNSSRSSHHQSGSFESLPTVVPPVFPDTTQRWSDPMHPIAAGGPSYSRSMHEQVPPPSAELVSRASETTSNIVHPNPSGRMHSAGEAMQQGGQHNVMNGYGTSMDEYMFVDFDLLGGFDAEAFPSVPSNTYSAPTRS